MHKPNATNAYYTNMHKPNATKWPTYIYLSTNTTRYTTTKFYC